MRIGVATAGVAAVIALGQGTAAATPSDPADTAGSSSSGAESAGTASSSATGAGAAQTADTGKSTDPETGQPSAAATATPGATDDADAADELGSAAADPTATAEPTTEDKSEASTEPTAADSEQVAPDGAGQDSEAVQHTGHTPAATPSAATARPTETASADADTTQPAAGTRTVSVAATTSAVAPEVAETVAVRSPEASATSVATLSAAPAAPRVTVKSMVTDVLTWIGLAPLATDLPIPETPVSAMIQSLWLGVRELQYYFNNQRPTAAPTLSGQGLGGTIAGQALVNLSEKFIAPKSGSVHACVIGAGHCEDLFVQPRHDGQSFVKRRCVYLATMQRKITYGKYFLIGLGVERYRM